MLHHNILLTLRKTTQGLSDKYNLYAHQQSITSMHISKELFPAALPSVFAKVLLNKELCSQMWYKREIPCIFLITYRKLLFFSWVSNYPHSESYFFWCVILEFAMKNQAEQTSKGHSQ